MVNPTSVIRRAEKVMRNHRMGGISVMGLITTDPDDIYDDTIRIAEKPDEHPWFLIRVAVISERLKIMYLESHIYYAYDSKNIHNIIRDPISHKTSGGYGVESFFIFNGHQNIGLTELTKLYKLLMFRESPEYIHIPKIRDIKSKFDEAISAFAQNV